MRLKFFENPDWNSVKKPFAGMTEAGGRGAYAPPDFGRIEGAAGQRRCAALLLAHPDFQTLRHA